MILYTTILKSDNTSSSSLIVPSLERVSDVYREKQRNFFIKKAYYIPVVKLAGVQTSETEKGTRTFRIIHRPEKHGMHHASNNSNHRS
jgi:hypothetical protein